MSLTRDFDRPSPEVHRKLELPEWLPGTAISDARPHCDVDERSSGALSWQLALITRPTDQIARLMKQAGTPCFRVTNRGVFGVTSRDFKRFCSLDLRGIALRAGFTILG